MNSEISAINEVLYAYASSCSGGDLERWMSLWTEDGVQMPPGSPTKVGKAEIRDAMSPAFKTMDLALKILEIEDTQVSGDMGITRCRYSLQGTPKAGGEPLQLMAEGKALTLYRKQPDGAWKIAYDCFNSDTD